MSQTYTLAADGNFLLNAAPGLNGPDGLALLFTITGTSSGVLAVNTAPPGAAVSLTNIGYLNGSRVAQSAGTAITGSGLAYVSAANAALDLYLVLNWTSGTTVVQVATASSGGSGANTSLPAGDITAGTFGSNSGETGGYTFPGDLTTNGTSAALAQSATSGTVAVGLGTQTSSAQLVLRGAAAQTRAVTWRTGSASSGNRWQASVVGAESGANAGALWSLNALDDSGVAIDSPLSIVRAASGAIYTSAGRSITFGGAPAAAATVTRNRAAITGIANNSATTVATITVPNAAHSATIKFTVVGSLGAGGAIGANEASAANSYYVTIARTAGVNAVAAISSAFGAAASAVAGAATVTAALTVAAVSGAVGATNTFPVQVTIARSGGSSTNHTALVTWEILNANSSGISVA